MRKNYRIFDNGDGILATDGEKIIHFNYHWFVALLETGNSNAKKRAIDCWDFFVRVEGPTLEHESISELDSRFDTLGEGIVDEAKTDIRTEVPLEEPAPPLVGGESLGDIVANSDSPEGLGEV